MLVQLQVIQGVVRRGEEQMSESDDALQKLRDALIRAGDVHDSAVALVEKMAVLQGEVRRFSWLTWTRF